MGNTQQRIEGFVRNAWSLGRIAYDAGDALRSPDDSRWLDALVVTAVFGRSVSQPLLRLRTLVDGFDEWWAPYAAEMEADPLMVWMNRLRNSTIKEGLYPPFETTRTWNNLTISGDDDFFPNAAPGSVTMIVTNAPTLHLGEAIIERSPQVLASLYTSYLERLTLDAQERFVGTTDPASPAAPPR